MEQQNIGWNRLPGRVAKLGLNLLFDCLCLLVSLCHDLLCFIVEGLCNVPGLGYMRKLVVYKCINILLFVHVLSEYIIGMGIYIPVWASFFSAVFKPVNCFLVGFLNNQNINLM